MSYLNKVVYLSEEQKNTLFANDTITVNNTTVTYNSDDLYIVPDEIDTSPTANSTNLVTSGGVYNAIHNYVPPLATKATAANLTTTTNAIAKYSNTTGSFANSGVTIDGSNNITAPTTSYIKAGTFQIGGSGQKVTNKIKSSDTFYIDRTMGNSIIFQYNGANQIWIDLPNNNFRPETDNTLNIGTQTYGWKNIFLSTGGSSALSQGISFTKSGTIKGKIGTNDNGGVGIYSTEGLSIYLRASLTNTDSGVIIKKSEVEFEAEDLKFTKDSKSASIIFNSTTNALDFVFA